MIDNKRGQGLSTNAIILIVLGVVVLGVLVIGFTMGWEKIAPWISTNNVNTIVTQCGVACSTDSMNSFCTTKRTLKADDVGFIASYGAIPVKAKSVTGSCYGFSHDDNKLSLVKYNVAKCPTITACSYTDVKTDTDDSSVVFN